jgi:hypothetical protein
MFGGKLAAVGDLSATLKTVGAKLGDTVQVRCEGAPKMVCLRVPSPSTRRARTRALPSACACDARSPHWRWHADG